MHRVTTWRMSKGQLLLIYSASLVSQTELGQAHDAESASGLCADLCLYELSPTSRFAMPRPACKLMLLALRPYEILKKLPVGLRFRSREDLNLNMGFLTACGGVGRPSVTQRPRCCLTLLL